MPQDVARNIAKNAKLLIGTIEQGQRAKSEEFRRRAEASGVGDLWDATYPGVPSSGTTQTATPAPPPAPAPNPFRQQR